MGISEGMGAALIVDAYAVPYALRARTLARRGRPVPAWRIWCFGGGLAVLALGHQPARARPARSSTFVAHMAEHLLIADVAALLLVLGLTGPVLARGACVSGRSTGCGS